MAASSRRQLMILGVLGVVLAGVLYYELAPGDAPPARPPRPAQNARAPKDGAPIAVDPVRLDVLKRTRPEPGEADRDPFTFEARRTAQVVAGAGTDATAADRADPGRRAPGAASRAAHHAQVHRDSQRRQHVENRGAQRREGERFLRP